MCKLNSTHYVCTKTNENKTDDDVEETFNELRSYILLLFACILTWTFYSTPNPGTKMNARISQNMQMSFYWKSLKIFLSNFHEPRKCLNTKNGFCFNEKNSWKSHQVNMKSWSILIILQFKLAALFITRKLQTLAFVYQKIIQVENLHSGKKNFISKKSKA